MINHNNVLAQQLQVSVCVFVAVVVVVFNYILMIINYFCRLYNWCQVAIMIMNSSNVHLLSYLVLLFCAIMTVKAVKDSRGGLEFKDFKLCGKTNLRKSGEPNKPQTFIYSIKIGDWLMLRTWSLLFVNYITKPARITGNTQLSSVWKPAKPGLLKLTCTHGSIRVRDCRTPHTYASASTWIKKE